MRSRSSLVRTPAAWVRTCADRDAGPLTAQAPSAARKRRRQSFGFAGTRLIEVRFMVSSLYLNLYAAIEIKPSRTCTTRAVFGEDVAAEGSRLTNGVFIRYRAARDRPARGVASQHLEAWPHNILTGPFLEWDSYYDFLRGRFAQTLKPGMSRAFGANRRWVG